MYRRALFTRLSRKSFLLVATSAISLLIAVALPVSAAATTIEAAQTVAKTNHQRSRASLSPLVVDKRLTQSARTKAEHMITHDYWDHNAPDGSTPWTFIRQAGFEYESAGENLARGFTTTEAMVTGWMNSPMHRDNVLNQSFTHIGIGIAEGVLEGVRTTVVVAHYGTPSHQVEQAVHGVSASAPARHIQSIEDVGSILSRVWEQVFRIIAHMPQPHTALFG